MPVCKRVSVACVYGIGVCAFTIPCAKGGDLTVNLVTEIAARAGFRADGGAMLVLLLLHAAVSAGAIRVHSPAYTLAPISTSRRGAVMMVEESGDEDGSAEVDAGGT